MILSKISQLSALRSNLILAKRQQSLIINNYRNKTHYRSGAIKPRPETMPLGIVGVFCAVIPGLFVGAAISKSVANFLEENDLFVPSDDDDDED